MITKTLNLEKLSSLVDQIGGVTLEATLIRLKLA